MITAKATAVIIVSEFDSEDVDALSSAHSDSDFSHLGIIPAVVLYLHLNVFRSACVVQQLCFFAQCHFK